MLATGKYLTEVRGQMSEKKEIINNVVESIEESKLRYDEIYSEFCAIVENGHTKTSERAETNRRQNA